jgi:hypothetical protein
MGSGRRRRGEVSVSGHRQGGKAWLGFHKTDFKNVAGSGGGRAKNKVLLT